MIFLTSMNMNYLSLEEWYLPGEYGYGADGTVPPKSGGRSTTYKEVNCIDLRSSSLRRSKKNLSRLPVKI